jgi:hypothetical protein
MSVLAMNRRTRRSIMREPSAWCVAQDVVAPVVASSRQTEWMWLAPFWVLSYSMTNVGPRTA